MNGSQVFLPNLIVSPVARIQDLFARLDAGLARQSQARRQGLTGLACFALLCGVALQRLRHPGIWAEDGVTFLSQALEAGNAFSLWNVPAAGYYQVAPRLVMALSLLFPLRYFGLILALLCTGAYAAIASTFCRDSYRWLVRSDALRCGLCLLWGVNPGINETLGNACNLHNPLFMYLALLAWRDLATPLTAVQLGAACLAMGSEGGVLVLLPVYGGRVLLQAAARRWRPMANEAVALLLMVAWSLAHWQAKADAVRSGMFGVAAPEIWPLLRGTLRLALERFALFPIAGRRFYDSVRVHDLWRVWAFGVPLAAGVIALLGRRFGGRRLLGVLAVPGAVMGLSVVTWIVRMGALEVMESTGMLGRYVVATPPFASILWISALEPLPRLGRALAAAVMLAAVMLAWPHAKLGPYGRDISWEATAEALEAQRGPTCGEVILPQYPGGWTFRYRNPEPAPGLQLSGLGDPGRSP